MNSSLTRENVERFLGDLDTAPEYSLYITKSIERFYQSLLILSQMKIDKETKVLELGSYPYFMSALFLEYLGGDLVGLQLPPVPIPGQPYEKKNEIIRISNYRSGKAYQIPVASCNVELDEFPFESKSFDLVLCQEIIEHLLFSPVQMLCEIHRVLKSDGLMFLTTPNTLRAAHTLAVIGGINPYDPYSSYGPYGRHSREYTLSELKVLLEKNNFLLRNAKIGRGNIPSRHQIINEVFARLFPWRRECLYIVAQPVGETIRQYPTPIFGGGMERYWTDVKRSFNDET
jgi:SAM-dependent methyltransferase